MTPDHAGEHGGAADQLIGDDVDTDAPDGVVLDQSFAADNLFALRNAVAAHGAELGLGDQRLADLVLLAHELASNAVRHAGATAALPGRLRLRLSLDGEGPAVSCEVSDSGGGLSLPEDAGRHPVELTAGNGRGLWIARQVADRLEIISTPAGTTITATIRLPGPSSPG